jgi:hypothetical protein
MVKRAAHRDHELVRYILDNVRLPDGAERVALAAPGSNRVRGT